MSVASFTAVGPPRSMRVRLSSNESPFGAGRLAIAIAIYGSGTPSDTHLTSEALRIRVNGLPEHVISDKTYRYFTTGQQNCATVADLITALDGRRTRFVMPGTGHGAAIVSLADDQHLARTAEGTLEGPGADGEGVAYDPGTGPRQSRRLPDHRARLSTTCWPRCPVRAESGHDA